MAKAMKNGAVIIGCMLLMLTWNCSTKKDSFLNRTGHAMSTKYNVLYNGNIAFDETDTSALFACVRRDPVGGDVIVHIIQT